MPPSSQSAARTGEFTNAQFATLCEAIRTDDEIDELATLPDRLHLDYDCETVSRCFRLSCQLWIGGIDRRAFAALARDARRGTLDEDGLRSFKDARALFKQLRFTCATLTETHRYPRIVDWATQTMGRLQDGVRNGDTGVVTRNAAALRIMLSRPVYRMMRHEVAGLRLVTAEDFRKHVQDEIAVIAAALTPPEITGKSFHRLRKTVSRLGAFANTLKTLEPSPYHDQIWRYLATINGMMGAMHDDLVATKLRDRTKYLQCPFAMPAAIRGRLETLVRSCWSGCGRTDAVRDCQAAAR